MSTRIANHEYIPELSGPQSLMGPDKRRILAKGGNGGQAYYAEAENLYKAQADTANFMLGIGKQYLPDAVSRYSSVGQNYFDPGYAARMAGEAGIKAQQSIDQARAATKREMARYGINPASGAYRSIVNAGDMTGAAIKAGAINAARMGVEDKRLGVAKDFYSSLVGMPSDAASAAGSAASGFANLGANAQQRANSQAAALGNIAALGYEVFMAADGGEIKPGRHARTKFHDVSERIWRESGAKRGETASPQERHGNECAVGADGARKMALGGLFKQPQPPALAATTAPSQPQPANTAPIRSGIKVAKMFKDGPTAAVNKLQASGGRLVEQVGNFVGNPVMAAKGIGTQAASTGTDILPAIKAYNEAGMTDIAAGLGKGAGIDATTGLSATSETASTLAAQNAAFGADAAAANALTTEALATGMGTTAEAGAAGAAAAEATGAGLTGALGTAAAALPWLGAAIAIGSLLDLFNEGGEVGARREQAPSRSRTDYRAGGDVTGPTDGTTTSDMVPAWLTHGEFVVNAEAVDMGNNREKLQKMNAAGLAKRYGTGKTPKE